MEYRYEIPQEFWGLFRSANREIYMEALLAINEEYEYSNYFLSRETCVQVLSEMCNARAFAYQEEWDAQSDPEETGMSLPRKILNWLLRHKWLRKVEDFGTMSTNIVIPDYASLFITAFDQMVNEPLEDTQVYIQNVYATLFSFRRDSRMNIAMLKTALVNTRKLNKALQDMLLNMDKFFGRLLDQQTFGGLLQEHLEGYVEEVVRKKYHILKTSDNFYIYKADIKKCLREMREDEEWLNRVRANQGQIDTQNGSNAMENMAVGMTDSVAQATKKETVSKVPGAKTAAGSAYYRRHQDEDVLELIDRIERAFDDIEHRITNMDKEHSKYVRSTVSRMNYLLSEDSDRKGLVIQLLNRLADCPANVQEERIHKVAQACNLSDFGILHENPLYKRRNRRKFEELVKPQEETKELSRDEVLKLNRLQKRFTKKQVEDFIEEHLEDGICNTAKLEIKTEDEFELLILAYDMCMRKNSNMTVSVNGQMIESEGFSYPSMLFMRKDKNPDKSRDIEND